ncbi:MAG TPA: rhodanese-like domain-containing protein [Bryobacteraceae bacterium]|nr:rhodanese-like domain-containing protein [Bryobacteraceae bacterium]
MKTFRILISAVLGLALAAFAHASTSPEQPAQTKAASADSLPTIQPEDLVKALNAKAGKPLLLHVGFHNLYVHAHIPGSEYAGPASRPEGMEQLKKRVASLPHNTYIVIYCGCCPWVHCPNIHPAFEELRRMGFTNVKVLYIASNFGQDWIQKNYPVARGE